MNSYNNISNDYYRSDDSEYDDDDDENEYETSTTSFTDYYDWIPTSSYTSSLPAYLTMRYHTHFHRSFNNNSSDDHSHITVDDDDDETTQCTATTTSSFDSQQ